MNAREEKSDKSGLHYQIVGRSKNRERVTRSVIQHQADSPFSIFSLSLSLPAPCFPLRLMDILPLSSSTSRFPTRNVVLGRATALSLLHRPAANPVREKADERTSREKNALEISFAGQFIGEKAMPSYRWDGAAIRCRGKVLRYVVNDMEIISIKFDLHRQTTKSEKKRFIKFLFKWKIL